jgi:hypothetical protein
MVEKLQANSLGELNPARVIDAVVHSPPRDAVQLSEFASGMIQDGVFSAVKVVSEAMNTFENSQDVSEQAKLLVFLLNLEEKPRLHEGTEELLDELKGRHEYTEIFSPAFQRFISERLRLIKDPRSRRGYEDIEETKKIIDLLKQNQEFFYDLISLQEFFTSNVSPRMPVNATWNPDLTQRFRVKNAAGLWYVYSHGFHEEYIRSMKEHFSSEWTGFNRFAEEPWEVLGSYITKNGNMLDVGSSIGISAVEIAQLLGIQGSIILVDFYNPFRNASSLRVIDYAQPQRRFILLDDAIRRMEILRGARMIIQLFGVDIGKPLSAEVSNIITGSAFVHCANTFPYIQSSEQFQAVENILQITDVNGGILRIHQDQNLPLDNHVTSITLQRRGSSLSVLRDFVKIKNTL